MAKDTAIVAV